MVLDKFYCFFQTFKLLSVQCYFRHKYLYEPWTFRWLPLNFVKVSGRYLKVMRKQIMLKLIEFFLLVGCIHQIVCDKHVHECVLLINCVPLIASFPIDLESIEKRGWSKYFKISNFEFIIDTVSKLFWFIRYAWL